MMTRHLKCWLLLVLWICCPASLFADIRIFGLVDFDLGKWVIGAGPLRQSSNICVSVRPRGPYQVTAFGSGGASAFALSNGADVLPYRIFFNDRPRPNGATELLPSQVLGGLRGRRRGILRNQCNRPTANISILISDTDLGQMSAGRYSGRLVIVVGPE